MFRLNLPIRQHEANSKATAVMIAKQRYQQQDGCQRATKIITTQSYKAVSCVIFNKRHNAMILNEMSLCSHVNKLWMNACMRMWSFQSYFLMWWFHKAIAMVAWNGMTLEAHIQTDAFNFDFFIINECCIARKFCTHFFWSQSWMFPFTKCSLSENLMR